MSYQFKFPPDGSGPVIREYADLAHIVAEPFIQAGDLAIALDTCLLYIFDLGTLSWRLLGPANGPDSIHVDGSNSPIAPIDWGGQSLTNVGNIEGAPNFSLGMPFSLNQPGPLMQITGARTFGAPAGNVDILGGRGLGGGGTGGLLTLSGGVSENNPGGHVIVSGGEGTGGGGTATVVGGSGSTGGAPGGSLTLAGGLGNAAPSGEVIIKTNNTQRVKVTEAGSSLFGIAVMANNATDGFVYIPTVVGAPTGTPTLYPGVVAMVYDGAQNKLWVYNSTWKSVTLA